MSCTAAKRLADPTILLILGWYLLVLMDREADAAAGVIPPLST